MPAPVSPPDLSPSQLRLYRSQPQRTTLLWVVLVVVVAIAMLAPVILSKATPSTRQATAPLVVSDPLAGSELHLADRECPVDALALTGQGWNCPGLHIEAITTPHAGDPDLALRRMFRFITRTDLPEGDILREGEQRLLIEPNGRGIAMSTSAMGASQVIVFRGLISENLDIITSSWREISGNALPEIIHELLQGYSGTGSDAAENPLPQSVHNASVQNASVDNAPGHTNASAQPVRRPV
ncbi:hypothetical protein [Corynebacterium propinquum]